MSKGYEAAIVRALARAAEKGFLYRGKKPVYWCITDRTALAEAEVEYEDHASPSIYVAFDLVGALPDPKLAGRKARLVIWTTTPWTLPANLAVSAHPEFAYVAYDLDGQVVVVAKDLLAPFLAAVAPAELAAPDRADRPLAAGARGGDRRGRRRERAPRRPAARPRRRSRGRRSRGSATATPSWSASAR